MATLTPQSMAQNAVQMRPTTSAPSLSSGTRTGLTPDMMKQNYEAMKASSPSAQSKATPSSSWDAFDRAMGTADTSGDVYNPASNSQADKPSIGGEAFKAGGEQINAGVDKVTSPNSSLLERGEGALQAGAGAVGMITSPIAPLLKPAEVGLEAASHNPLVESKPMQDFAQSPVGQGVSRAATDISNASTIAGAVVGGMDAAPSIGGALSDVAGTAKSMASDIAGGAKNLIPERVPKPVVDTLVPEAGKVTPEIAQTKAWNDLKPKETPTTKLAYAKQGNTTPQGTFTSGKLKPSAADTKLIADYSKMYEDGTIKDSMTPQEKQAAVSQKASQLNQQQKEFLATHDKAVTLSDAKGKTGVFDRLDATAKKSSLPFSRDASTKGAYDSVVETYKSLLSTGKSAGTVKGATTLTKMDAALTQLDSEMQKFGAWGKTKTGEMTDTGMARQQAIRDIHTAVRDYIADELPKNSPWKAIRLEESNMYQIGDRLAQRSADTVGTSKVGAAIKNNPVIKAGIHAAGAATGAGAAIHLIP